MKYYIDINNNLYANPSNLDGLVEVESAVRADGTLLPKHKNLGDVETREDDRYYTYYNPDGTPDLVKEQEVIDASLALEVKQQKLLALSELTVTTANGNTLDADDVARQDMLSAIDASVTLGLTENSWKMADNSWVVITLEELREASALAIQAKGAILAEEEYLG